jgi:hypothetical protein
MFYFLLESVPLEFDQQWQFSEGEEDEMGRACSTNGGEEERQREGGH